MGNAMDQWMADNPDVTVVNDSSEDTSDQVDYNDPDPEPDPSGDDGRNTRPNSSVPNNLSGGGGGSDDTDRTPEPTSEQEQLLSGGGEPATDPDTDSGDGGDSGGDELDFDTSGPPEFDEPSVDQDTPFDDGGGGGGGFGGGGGPTLETDDGPSLPDEPSLGDNPFADDSGGDGGGSGGGSDTPPGLSDPPSSVQPDDDTQRRDPSTITEREPEPAPEQGIEETGDGQIQQQAQELEFEATQQLAEQLGRSITERDVRVTRAERNEQQVLQAELTRTGQEQVDREQFQRQFQARRRAIGRVDEQTEADLTAGDDFTVGDDRIRLTAQGRVAEAAAQTPGVSEDELTVEGGRVVRQDSGQQQAITPAERSDNQPAGFDDAAEAAVTTETDLFEQQVARAERLTGTDVPGEGDILPGQIDISRGIEAGTGVDLPETAGGFLNEQTGAQEFVTGVAGAGVGAAADAADRAGETAVPFTSYRFDSLPGRVAGLDVSPPGSGPVLGSGLVYGRSAVTGETTEEAAEEIGEEIPDPEDRPATGVGPAVGPNPAAGAAAAGRAASSFSAVRGALGIGGITGGAFAVRELAVPDEQGQEGELETPEQEQRSELDAPTAPQEQQGELQPGEMTPQSEIGIPQQRQIRQPDVLRTQQILGVPEQEPEEQREITEEDLVQDRPGRIGRGINRGPRINEEREGGVSDLYNPQRPVIEEGEPILERTFPTGGSAVVDGTGTGQGQDLQQQAQQREAAEQAETQTEVQTQQPRTDIIGRQDQAQTPGQTQTPAETTEPALDQPQAEVQIPGLGQPNVPETGEPTEPGNPYTPGLGTPNVPGTGNPPATGIGGPPGDPSPPRRPPRPQPQPSSDDDEEERRGWLGRVGEIRTDFRNPLTGEVAEGGSPAPAPTLGDDEDRTQAPGLPDFGGFWG